MKDRQLIPEVSTHFRWIASSISNLTEGKIYKIMKWEGYSYSFLSDNGVETTWGGQNGVEDASYEENLE